MDSEYAREKFPCIDWVRQSYESQEEVHRKLGTAEDQRATVIQRNWRRHRAQRSVSQAQRAHRTRAHNVQQNVRAHEAATTVQSAWRCAAARRRVKERRKTVRQMEECEDRLAEMPEELVPPPLLSDAPTATGAAPPVLRSAVPTFFNPTSATPLSASQPSPLRASTLTPNGRVAGLSPVTLSTVSLTSPLGGTGSPGGTFQRRPLPPIRPYTGVVLQVNGPAAELRKLQQKFEEAVQQSHLASRPEPKRATPEEENQAAVRLQCLHRSRKARATARKQRVEREEREAMEDAEASAVAIQAKWRTSRARQRTETMKLEGAARRAALKIQCLHRSRKARAAARKRRVEREEREAMEDAQASAVAIQAKWRTSRARQRAETMKLEGAARKAALKIQCQWRCRGARRVAETRARRQKCWRSQLADEDAAAMVQAAWRGRVDRQAVMQKRAQQAAQAPPTAHKAATQLQCAWRSRVARQRRANLRAQRDRDEAADVEWSAAIVLQQSWLTSPLRLRSLKKRRQPTQSTAKKPQASPIAASDGSPARLFATPSPTTADAGSPTIGAAPANVSSLPSVVAPPATSVPQWQLQASVAQQAKAGSLDHPQPQASVPRARTPHNPSPVRSYWKPS
eukprot:NODE_305_length_2107_cov_34.329798_g299_i0.p1 GENE.NODE_305_length_2107_cov_34.329798_g299_i0~~NODE_305_length_2107_cov_34.329798_g299_i0.p1  ORF type:complete len:670 (-),score=139.95 NODE_305_length_2107_cov_34.329798_g299_i0:96-1973(-)